MSIYSDPTTLDTYPLAEAAILHEKSAAFYGADAGDLAIFLHERPDLWEGPGEDHAWTVKDGFLNELRRFTDFDQKIKKIIELSVDPDKETTLEDFLDEFEEAIQSVNWYGCTYASYGCTDDPCWTIAIFVAEVEGDFEFAVEFTDDQEDVPIEDRKIKVTSGVVSWGLK